MIYWHFVDFGVYVNGKIYKDEVVYGLQRPDDVDIEYGLMLNGKPTDIAVATERMTHKLRVYSLPDMKPVDGGGLEMFVDEVGEYIRDLMGIGLYKAKSGKIYAIVGRKSGPTDGTYLWQYLLEDNGAGKVRASLVRKFGIYSGFKEIESIAVDDELGYSSMTSMKRNCYSSIKSADKRPDFTINLSILVYSPKSSE